MTNFDHIDVFYLANSLSIKQLRAEIDAAEVRAAVADNIRGTEYALDYDVDFPYRDFVEACREAIKWQQQSKPKQTPTPTGHIDIEAIKVKNDIVAVIEGYTKLHKAGKNFTGRCPIHNDKHPSMTIYPDSQSWHCFGCNRGGDVIAFIQAVENTGFKGAVERLRG